MRCSTNGPVDAFELNIQLDTEADGLAKEPGWCVSLDAPQMDMSMHMDTVVNHFGCSADRHADAQWFCQTLLLPCTVLMLMLLLLSLSLNSTTSYNCKYKWLFLYVELPETFSIWVDRGR